MDPRIGANPATRIRLEVIMDRDMDGKDLIQSVVRECRWESSIENVGLTRQTSTIQSHRAQVVGTSLGRPFMLFFVLFLVIVCLGGAIGVYYYSKSRRYHSSRLY